MEFAYYDMLTGEPLLYQGVGHIKSPKLREISPGSGIGYELYQIYLSFFFWTKEDLLRYDDAFGIKGVERLKNPKLSFFDAAVLIPMTREFCREILSFFIIEDIRWDNKSYRFLVFDTVDEGKDKCIGEISNKNYEDLRDAILQLNYINLNKDKKEVTFENAKAKELWEKAQRLKAEQEERRRKERGKSNDDYNIGNVISKLCAISCGSYNYFNVFELTIFQLYDAFFQYGYLKGIKLSEDIFTRVGGEKFRFEDWLKPIINIKRRT